MKSIPFIVTTILISLALIGGYLVASYNQVPMPWHTNDVGNAHAITVYKSPDCGCCTIHADYLERAGYRLERVLENNMDDVKKRFGIPDELLSCHTTIINDGQYYIEGHIPEPAIAKLLEEEPDIKGIGMPGMPAGSPGMPGRQTAPFEIMQVDNQDAIDMYLSL